MYCRNCGKEIENHLAQCPYCNTPVLKTETVAEDNDNLCWGVLGCCIPVVGLILYIVWRNTKLDCAKKAGVGAAIGFVLDVVILILVFMAIVYSIAAVEMQ